MAGSGIDDGLQVLPCGPRAVLVEFADGAQARAFYAIARRHQELGDVPAAVEMVPAHRTVLFDGCDDPRGLVRSITGWANEPVDEGPPREHTIPTRYDGADLAAVAAHWGLSTDDAVERHAALRFEVAFIGFAPGFAYLTGLPSELATPRLRHPRPKVPAGSVAVADRYTAIYPRSSPGGWQLIGTTDVELWSIDRSEPALLRPGDRVRFAPR